MVGFSQNLLGQVVIKGKVLDQQDNSPLPGANIYLLNNWRIGVSSDIKGEFVFTVAEEDLKRDTLICSFIGFEDFKTPLINWNEGTIQLVALDKSLDEVTIEASKLVAEEFQYQEIKKLEIYTNPAAKADPLLAVNSLASATPVDESANISLRGSPSAQTGVFFNDVPIYDYVKFSQLNGIGVFSIFNTAIVKEVAVFPGSPPLEYGNSSSGLIGVTSDETIPKVNSNSLTISPASFGYFRQQRLSKKVALSFFGNYQLGGILKKLNPGSLQNIRNFNLFDGGVYLLAKPGKTSLVKVFNYSLSEQYTFAFRSPSFIGDFGQARNRNFTTLKYEFRKNRHSVNLNGGYSFSKADFAFSQFETNLKGKDHYIGLNYQYVGEQFEWKVGLSSDNRNQLVNGNAPLIPFALRAEHPTINFDSGQRISVDEGFLYGKFYPTEFFSVGLGLRSNFALNRNAYLSRQLNLKFQFSNALSLVIGGGRYHQRLIDRTGSNLFVQADQLSADLKWSSIGWQANASIFWKRDRKDLADGAISGVEVYLERKIVESLEISFSASYLNADVPVSLKELNPSSINYYVRSNFNWNFRGTWSLAGNVLYREGSTYSQVDRTLYNENLQVFEPLFSGQLNQLPNYFSMGLSLSNQFAISEKFTVIGFASLNNLTNHRNVRSIIYNVDYSNSEAELFSLRTLYFGAVINC